MGSDERDDQTTRSRYRAEVKEKTRATAISGGLIAIVGFPAWAAFDYLVEPANAADFALLRVAFTLPIALCVAALVSPIGKRHPERLMLAILVLVEVAIAIMIGRVEEHYAAYALGMSLAIYASAFLLIWAWRYTAALIAASIGALVIAILTAPDTLDGAAITTLAFYLGTASVIALVAQVYRERLAWSEFQGRAALEREQERSNDLLERLERLSREDPLTGLANRRSWDEALEREFARAVRAGLPLTILICDVDRFKVVNDRCGHAIGDRVLKTVAGVLVRRVRAGDLVARIGGDEFAILCADTDVEGGAALAETLRRRIEATTFPERLDDVVTISLGAAQVDPADDSPREAMVRADACLYDAKRHRNAVSADERRRARPSAAPGPVSDPAPDPSA